MSEQVTHTFHIPIEIAERDYPNAQHHYFVWLTDWTLASGVEIWTPERGRDDGKT